MCTKIYLKILNSKLKILKPYFINSFSDIKKIFLTLALVICCQVWGNNLYILNECVDFTNEADKLPNDFNAHFRPYTKAISFGVFDVNINDWYGQKTFYDSHLIILEYADNDGEATVVHNYNSNSYTSSIYYDYVVENEAIQFDKSKKNIPIVNNYDWDYFFRYGFSGHFAGITERILSNSLFNAYSVRPPPFA